MSKNILHDFSLNEIKLCEILLSLDNDSINSRISEMIKNNSYVFIFHSVCKYLIHIKGYEPIQALDMIRKYAVIVSYKYIIHSQEIKKLKCYNEYKIEAFDEILERGLSCDDLTRNLDLSNSVLSDFINYFNGDNCYVYIKSIDKVLKKLDIYKKNLSDNILRILKCDYKFFSSGNRIELYDKMANLKRFDMIVAEAAIDKSFISFEFSLSENTISNIFKDDIVKISKQLIKRATIFIGYLIHYAIEDDNLTFKKPLRYINSVRYIFSCCEKDVNVNKANLRFVKSVMKSNKYSIEFKKNDIAFFEFTYNGRKGSMNSKGITIERNDGSLKILNR